MRGNQWGLVHHRQHEVQTISERGGVRFSGFLRGEELGPVTAGVCYGEWEGNKGTD